MIHKINGTQFAEMILSASAAIEMARQAVNELNVFPVPDGDTGTNMSLTMNKAAVEIRKNMPPEIGRAATTVAEGLLHGARGNSGVILSLLFRGFARRVKEHDLITGTELAEALAEGVDAAYHAIMKPTEGTILTVSRMAAARAKIAATKDNAVEYVLTEALEAAESALAETIHQNPVLAKAGVVDAGGKGYCIILDGMLSALQGRVLTAPANEDRPRDKADFSEYSTEDIRFPYCTEFIVAREGKRDARKLSAFLGSMGDSLVFVDDEKIIKAHIHTQNPGKILEEALRYGPLHSVKIENMRLQHTEQANTQTTDKAETVREIAKPKHRYGFVAVCTGEGMAQVFGDLGVEQIVTGGQTMNPSTQELLAAVDRCPSEIVFVLPNNKNIIMAAEQCVPLSDKQVIILPSCFVPQGMSAMLAFEPAAEPEENREAMIAAMSNVATGQVTYAARASSFDGHEIREGDHMALLNGKLMGTHKDRNELLSQLAIEMEKNTPGYIILFRGEGVDDREAEQAKHIFETQCPNTEINLLDGGQPVYAFVISAE